MLEGNNTEERQGMAARAQAWRGCESSYNMANCSERDLSGTIRVHRLLPGVDQESERRRKDWW